MAGDTEVIILAQGEQRRLGVLGVPKQLLPLPACADTPIMARTVRQVWRLAEWWPTIVTWPWIRADATFKEGTVQQTITPAYVTLPQPGSSALKGIARYLEQRSRENRRYSHTIVLLGDVVYSWACLQAIWGEASESYGFVGTKNLSMEAGELWGAAWSKEFDDSMMAPLRDALLRTPPFDDEYAPGQLRRWISGMQRGDLRDHAAKLRRFGHYTDIDDYTHDIDIPHDVVLLPDLSVAAADDDAKHGILWSK